MIDFFNRIKTGAPLFFQTTFMMALLSIPNVSFAQEDNFQEMLPEQSLELSSQQSDAEILQSLDSFGDELSDKAIFSEEGDAPTVLPDEILSHQSMKAKQLGDETNVSELANDDLLAIDSFDGVDIDLIMEEEHATDPSFEKPFNKMHSLSQYKQQGVGVLGKEEAIINQLDKSDLMDFDKNVDFWNKEVSSKKDMTLPVNKMDEVELQELELDEFSDINDIDFEAFLYE